MNHYRLLWLRNEMIERKWNWIFLSDVFIFKMQVYLVKYIELIRNLGIIVTTPRNVHSAIVFV